MSPTPVTFKIRRGLVPRTFAAGPPLTDQLRPTVRSNNENDRLPKAAAEITAGGPS
jgi:histidinol-phosphate/aromatic aminotransferase/cobyric acid decarboxylase-like protein